MASSYRRFPRCPGAPARRKRLAKPSPSPESPAPAGILRYHSPDHARLQPTPDRGYWLIGAFLAADRLSSRWGTPDSRSSLKWRLALCRSGAVWMAPCYEADLMETL